MFRVGKNVAFAARARGAAARAARSVRVEDMMVCLVSRQGYGMFVCSMGRIGGRYLYDRPAIDERVSYNVSSGRLVHLPDLAIRVVRRTRRRTAKEYECQSIMLSGGRITTHPPPDVTELNTMVESHKVWSFAESCLE